MYNSIQHFMDKGVEKLEKVVKDFMNEKEMCMGEFVESIMDELKGLGRNIIGETIEEIDQAYRTSAHRKERYFIERKNDENSFMSTCGEIKYCRTYFKSKEDGSYVYLADETCGITKNMRKSEDVTVEIIKHANESSYRLSGEHAVSTEDVISKQAVMKEVHELEIPAVVVPEGWQKKQKKIIYINADEDHVALQFNKKKGDLKKNENGRKSNTIEPKLVCIFEGIEEVSETRNRLINKYTISGVYKKSTEIWEDVLEYIDKMYDEAYIEKIYIMGDGASWIRTGVDVLGSKCTFVLDKFHLNQAIRRAISHLGDSAEDMLDDIRDAICFEEKESLRETFDKIRDVTESEAKREQIRRTRVYIINNWDAVIRPNTDRDARVGCSAEGQVSHLLSSRLSSRPMGWSETGVDKVSRLRAYMSNNREKVYDLLKYREEKVARKLSEEILEERDRKVRSKRCVYNETVNKEMMPSSVGRVTGMYQLSKKFRGICG